MKASKHFLLRGILILMIVSLIALLFPNLGTVHALFTGARGGYAIWRFEREVLRSTRVGQYYEGLIFKHAPEVGDLLSKDPDSRKKFMVLGETTLPLLEAFMNGDGDSAIITVESINSIKDILNSLNIAASPSLQKDIQAEYERFPLDNFVGMSMNEAYDHVLDSFAEVLEQPTLVEGTNGKWAYYIYNGVYFEYPSNWYVQVIERNEENESSIMIIPSSENPSSWDVEWLVVGVATDVSLEKASTENFSFNTSGYDILWQESIRVDDINGIEYAARQKITGALVAELYDPEKRIFIDAGVALFGPTGFYLDDRKAAGERYEYVFHLIESINIVEP